MLLPKDTWQGLVDGSITVAFRRWRRPTVRAGGTLKAPPGELAIDEVAAITPGDITDEDARRAGETGRDRLLERLAGYDGQLYRVRFHYLGEDPRRELATRVPDDDELAAVLRELDDIDRRSRRGAWTRPLLEMVATQPDTRAVELAAQLGRQRDPLKRDVRRLKELGLTYSQPRGYRLSPRGEAVLRASRPIPTDER